MVLIYFLVLCANLTCIWNSSTEKSRIESSREASDIFKIGMKNIFVTFGQDYTEYSFLSEYYSILQSKGQKLHLTEKSLFSTAMDEICQGIASDENFHKNYTQVQKKQEEIDKLLAKLTDNDLIKKHETAFKQNI